MEEPSKRASLRYEKFLDAAFEVFVEKGFEGAQLSQIIKKAGGSLATLYKYFDSKEGLFEVILKQKFEHTLSKINSSQIFKQATLETALKEFGCIFLDTIFKDEAVALSRLLLSEGSKNNAELGNIFIKHRVFNKVLARIFTKHGVCVDDDEHLEFLSNAFMSLLAEPYHVRAIVLGHKIELSKTQKDLMIQRAVKVFTGGIDLLTENK
ncbi:MAG: TetR/AcrR family transcriptional regulator [Helicobacteraceae bacterium]